MQEIFAPSSCRRLIVKVGSSLLITADGMVRRAWLEMLVADIAGRMAAGQQVAIVSSGAIALGARRLKLPKRGRATLEDAQAAAATGQIALAGTWAELLGAHGLNAAQILVTLDDLEDRRRYLNVSATLARLMDLGVVPVINENDSVATTEIRFGDNDRLAARIAAAAGARGVVLLSDVDGLYTADPTRNPAAERIARVTRIDGRIRAMVQDGSSSGMGSGGMATKIESARIAGSAGADLMILSGDHDHPLSRIGQEDAGTLFIAPPAARSRKAWLAGRMSVRGAVHIDAGAAAALHGGASLLPAGIVRVDGSFARGDVIDVLADGVAVARGLAEYDAADADRIKGRKRTEIAAVLGHEPRSAMIHRDHLVRL